MALHLSKEVYIERPPAEVWDHVADLKEELRWRRPYVIGLDADGDPLAPGTRIAGTTRAFGQTDTYVNEVAEVVPPQRLAWRGVDASGALVGTAGAYELAPQGEGTRFRLSIDYQPRGFAGRLQAPLLGLVLRWILARFMRQIKALSEAS
jgi:uncharacterized protein YndB with AHSA1/START domain